MIVIDDVEYEVVSRGTSSYAISRAGIVVRFEGRRNHLGQETPHIVLWSNNGARYNCINVGNKVQYIHRLVAQAYIPNPDNHKYVGHIDHDRSNNHVDNLYWTDAATNTRHGIEDGKINYKGRLNGPMVKHTDNTLSSAYVDVKLGVGVQQTATKYGINRTTLSSWINKRSRQELTDLIDLELEGMERLKENNNEKHEN